MTLNEWERSLLGLQVHDSTWTGWKTRGGSIGAAGKCVPRQAAKEQGLQHLYSLLTHLKQVPVTKGGGRRIKIPPTFPSRPGTEIGVPSPFRRVVGVTQYFAIPKVESPSTSHSKHNHVGGSEPPAMHDPKSLLPCALPFLPWGQSNQKIAPKSGGSPLLPTKGGKHHTRTCSPQTPATRVTVLLPKCLSPHCSPRWGCTPAWAAVAGGMDPGALLASLA